jgi:hypothetical protein
MKQIALDEVIEILNKHHGGTTNDAKKAKADLLEQVFASRSWERIGTFDYATVSAARNALWIKLEGKPYEFPKPPSEHAQEQSSTEQFDDVPQ